MKIERVEVERLLAEATACPSEDMWCLWSHEMAELCRTWLAVDSAEITPVSRQVGPINKPLSAIAWPDFETTYIKGLWCDKDGRLVAEGGGDG